MRLLLIVLLLSRLVPALTWDAQAQHSGTGRGAKGRINAEELRARLARQEEIDGYILQGEDLITILRERTLPIAIKNSIIEGGLDFTILPKTPSEQVELPPSWDDKTQDAWLTQRSLSDTQHPYRHILANSIHITATDIHSRPQTSPNVPLLLKFPFSALLFVMMLPPSFAAGVQW
jgi:hypothetical protein